MVDADFQILHYYGPTERYLAPPSGAARRDLPAWIRTGLFIQLHAVLRQAVEQQERVSVEGHLKRDGQTHQVRCTANPAFLRLPGIEKRPIEGMSLDALAVGDEWNYRDISDLVALVLRERRPLHDHEIQVNGVSLMVNADVMVHGGVAEQVLVALEDVTVHRDFKRASIDRAAEQQTQSLRKDVWIALLGHELRNPLGTVSTAVSLLSAGIDSEQERQQIVKLMQRQLHQVEALLDSLLDAARIVAGKLEIVSEPLDLVELLHGVVEAHRLKLKPHQSLQLDSPIPAVVIVLGDRTRLTGYRRDEKRLRTAGFDDHLSKPLSTVRLRQALADLDERQRGH